MYSTAMAVERLKTVSTAMAVECFNNVAVELQSGCRKKSGCRKTGNLTPEVSIYEHTLGILLSVFFRSIFDLF